MRALLGIEIVQIRLVLEVVGVQRAVFHTGVGHDVIVKFHNVQLHIVLGQEGLHMLQDFRVRAGRRAHLQRHRLRNLGNIQLLCAHGHHNAVVALLCTSPLISTATRACTAGSFSRPSFTATTLP